MKRYPHLLSPLLATNRNAFRPEGTRLLQNRQKYTQEDLEDTLRVRTKRTFSRKHTYFAMFFTMLLEGGLGGGGLGGR